MKLSFTLLIMILIFFTACSQNKIELEEPRVEIIIPELTIIEEEIIEEPLPEIDIFEWQQNDEFLQDGKATRLVVVKSKRVLVLFNKDGDILSRHRVSLGENPLGTKLKQGDKKTPEGTYSIRDIRHDPKYYKEILISYPNSMDKKRSRDLGFNPGGGITFHAQVPWNWNGNGDNYTLNHDWTNGCVSMTNYGMDIVWNMIDMDTIIEIRE